METLRRRSDFEQVFASGKFIGGRSLAVRVLARGEDVGPSRIGFAVGKRLDKRAVVRNRARRRLREAIRRVEVRDGYDLVVMARGPALKRSFAALQRDVRALFRRAGVLDEEAEA